MSPTLQHWVTFLGVIALFLLCLCIWGESGAAVMRCFLRDMESVGRCYSRRAPRQQHEQAVKLPAELTTAPLMDVQQTPAVLDPVDDASAAAELPVASSGEEEARNVMVRIFNGVPFPKVRPVWLLNPTTGRKLELDAYSESLAIAVEYDGEQHSVWPNAWHKTRADFDRQLLRDALKNTLCMLQGVTLIRVPHTVKRAAIEQYLRDKLALSGKAP